MLACLDVFKLRIRRVGNFEIGREINWRFGEGDKIDTSLFISESALLFCFSSDPEIDHWFYPNFTCEYGNRPKERL